MRLGNLTVRPLQVEALNPKLPSQSQDSGCWTGGCLAQLSSRNLLDATLWAEVGGGGMSPGAGAVHRCGFSFQGPHCGSLSGSHSLPPSVPVLLSCSYSRVIFQQHAGL